MTLPPFLPLSSFFTMIKTLRIFDSNEIINIFVTSIFFPRSSEIKMNDVNAIQNTSFRSK